MHGQRDSAAPQDSRDGSGGRGGQDTGGGGARGSVLVSRCRVTVMPGEAVTVDMVGSFRGGAICAAHMSTNGQGEFDTRARENLCAHRRVVAA